MRIHLLSDLHQEFRPFELPLPAADLLILAGDTNVKKHGVEWILEQNLSIPVIYVLGNHEYYREKMPRLSEKLKDMTRGTNVYVLENDSVEIQGYRFFGCTLWTDMNLMGDKLLSMNESMVMNDYRYIRNSTTYSKLRPANTVSQFFKSRIALEAFLSSGDPRKSVIVTHHAPSGRSLPEKRQGEYISAAYASNLEDLIEQTSPLLWVHGHIHHPVNYTIGKTRARSNPRGYPDEADRGFQKDLVIDLTELQENSSDFS